MLDAHLHCFLQCHYMSPATLSGEAEQPKVAGAVIEARYAIGAVGPRPLWTNWPNCGGGSRGANNWVRHSRNFFPPRWKRPSRFLTTSCCPPPRMRWSGATGAIARCKKVSTGYGRTSRSVRVLRWICGVKPKPKAVNKLLHHFIVHGLDKPGSSATVSHFRPFASGGPTQVRPPHQLGGTSGSILRDNRLVL